MNTLYWRPLAVMMLCSVCSVQQASADYPAHGQGFEHHEQHFNSGNWQGSHTENTWRYEHHEGIQQHWPSTGMPQPNWQQFHNGQAPKWQIPQQNWQLNHQQPVFPVPSANQLPHQAWNTPLQHSFHGGGYYDPGNRIWSLRQQEIQNEQWRIQQYHGAMQQFRHRLFDGDDFYRYRGWGRYMSPGYQYNGWWRPPSGFSFMTGYWWGNYQIGFPLVSGPYVGFDAVVAAPNFVPCEWRYDTINGQWYSPRMGYTVQPPEELPETILVSVPHDFEVCNEYQCRTERIVIVYPAVYYPEQQAYGWYDESTGQMHFINY